MSAPFGVDRAHRKPVMVHALVQCVQCVQCGYTAGDPDNPDGNVDAARKHAQATGHDVVLETGYRQIYFGTQRPKRGRPGD